MPRKIVTQVPAHTCDSVYCPVCYQHAAQEKILRNAVELAYLTNCAGDQHHTLVSKGNGHCFDLAYWAWEALGKPSEKLVSSICEGIDGWDGVNNAGIGEWFRNEREALEQIISQLDCG